MGRKITDYNGTVVPVGATYPYGQIKNNPGGTVIDVTSNGDIQQFFQRAAALSGVALNDNEDYFDNGWQYLDGVAGGINSYCVRLVRAMIGSAYDNTKWYVLAGTATSASQGWLFFNDNIYHVGTYSGPICGGGTVLVGSILPATSNTWYKEVNLSCAASGSGAFNYTDLVRVWGNGGWQALSTFQTGFASASAPHEAKYIQTNIGGNKYIQFRGQADNTTGSTLPSDLTMIILPTGLRPAIDMHFSCVATDNSTIWVCVPVTIIASTGAVVLHYGPGSSVNIDLAAIQYPLD